MSPDNFLYFIILFFISIFSGTYLMFAYYKDRLVTLNAIIFFLCAYRLAFEYYITTITTFQEMQTFVTWQGYGVLINLLIGFQWICMWFYVRPLKNWKWEKISNNIYLWLIVVVPFIFHSWFMADGKIFYYNPEKIDGYWQFTMNTGYWYYLIYSIHTKVSFLLVVVVLLIGVIKNKKNRLKQSLLLLSYIIIPYIYFSINVSSMWNIPNNGILHISQTIVLSWYLSNYRLFKSNIGLISSDIFNSITDITISTDADLNITSYNDQARANFDITSKKMKSFLSVHTIDPTIRPSSLIQDLSLDNKKVIELKMKDKYGNLKIMNLKASPFKNDNKLYGYTFLLTDFTTTIEKEKKLIELNNVKDTLFQIIGHDLKKPTINFRNVSKSINYLLEKEDYKRLKKLGKEVDQDAKSLYNLTDNLLNWALMQKDTISIKPENVNVHEIVNYNFELFAGLSKRKGISLKNQIGKDVFSLVDRNSLDTIVRNLIDNAIKYTDEGGKISLQSKITDGTVRVSITDTGIGMDQNKIDAIHNDQVIKSKKGTDNEKGSGIGLQLIKNLIKKNKGTLKIQSILGSGSTFTVDLPLAS